MRAADRRGPSERESAAPVKMNPTVRPGRTVSASRSKALQKTCVWGVLEGRTAQVVASGAESQKG